MSHATDALNAAAKCDSLTRRSRVTAHAEKLDSLLTTNQTLLQKYNKGPTGDIEKDRQTLGKSLLAIVNGVYLAKREHEARVDQIRTHDDILRGLVPNVYNGNGIDDRFGRETHEYIRRIQGERKRCTVSADTPNEYTAVPCTPELNHQGGMYKWFHPGVLFYQDDMDSMTIEGTLCLNFEWSEFATTHAHGCLEGTLGEVPFNWDEEMLAELQEANSRNS